MPVCSDPEALAALEAHGQARPPRRIRRRNPGPGEWLTRADGSRARTYPDYTAYVAHQASKLATMSVEKLTAHAERFEAALLERLAGVEVRGAKTALCLGAREGAEVRAFLRLGIFAVGVDLNPGPANRYVVAGDFHGTVFPDGSADVVYTNALDHVFNLEQVLADARRVLAPEGFLIVEATTKRPAEFEAYDWPSIDSLLASIEAAGFRLVSRTPIDVPWPGEQLVLEAA